jgi:hypothetical protein
VTLPSQYPPNSVEESEEKMAIVDRWEWESKEWEEAANLTETRKYRLCINELEALVLKRMFELTKMNMSGTGGLPVHTLSCFN